MTRNAPHRRIAQGVMRCVCNDRRRPALRAGTITPILVVAMIVLLLIGAWVIDRWWVSSAYGELVRATEAASRAAAAELLDDTRLTDAGEELRLRRARFAAEEFARMNLVAGQGTPLDPSRDVLFGKSADGPLYDDEIDPRVVAVTLHRSARRGTSLGLLLSGIGGVERTDITHTTVARLRNRLVGFAASERRPSPVIPLGILELGSEQVAGWDEMIVQGFGSDEYRFDRDEKTVTEAPDGLPEIAVVVDVSADANGAFVSETDFDADSLLDQVTEGFVAGPVLFDQLDVLAVSSEPQPAIVKAMAADDRIGRERILFLTDGSRVTGVVAGRVMAVRLDDLSRPVLIIQPCVMAVGQAMLPKGNEPESNVEPNPYLFKLMTAG